jgi:3-isopropylmalate/(R)-2-methylmalate dehydratase small subunit
MYDFSSKVAVISVNNIDTDQIIPARFLKSTDKKDMGKNLFADMRYHPDGKIRNDFILNDQRYSDAQVLLAGDNFGCGSSREHAIWALAGFGFKVVISTSFADIFRNNALKNGLLPIEVNEQIQKLLFEILAKNPVAEVYIDLENQTLQLPDGTTTQFLIDPFYKTCLLMGTDELGYLLSFQGKVEEYEKQHHKNL